MLKSKEKIIYMVLVFVACNAILLLNTKTVRADGAWYNHKQKVSVKKAGWYVLKNASKSSKACSNIYITKKKRDTSQNALPDMYNDKGSVYRVENGKNVKLYLKKGTYYIGQMVYSGSVVNKDIKLKYIGKAQEISDKQVVYIQGDVDYKNILLKFKATKTGDIRVGANGFRMNKAFYITLCNSKKQAISGKNKIYTDKEGNARATYTMGVRAGKTYYLKISGMKKTNTISLEYSSYYGSEAQWVSGYNSKKKSAVNLIEGSNKGYIGLTYNAEEQWFKYKYDESISQFKNGRMRISVYEEKLCWSGAKNNNFNVELYDNEGNQIKADEDGYFNNTGTTYIHITAGKGSPTKYSVYLKQR